MMNKKVEEYISKKEEWQKELLLLRSVFNDLPVEETIKWGAPTYTFNGKNIVSLAAFKSYCGLWFFQGALLKDKRKVFINAQENKTKAMLQWRFYSSEEIDINLIKEYVLESIENCKKGKEIKPDRSKKELVVPIELASELSKNKKFKENFDSFSNSRKIEFANYIAEAKKAETRLRRMEKIIPMILEKIGLHDQYKKC